MGLYPLTVNTPPEDPAHIYAEDDAAIYEAIVGGDGVYDIGNKMEATVIDNNTVRISNGVLSVGGHLARIKFGDYQDMVIDNGESGKNRNDLIVANFSTTGPRGVDTYTLKVIKGGAVSGEAADPVVADGNLYEGATERDLPLYRVRLEGISIVAVDVLYSMKNTMENMQKELAELNGKLESDQNSDVNPQGRLIGAYKGKKLYEVTVTGNMSGFTTKTVLSNVNKAHNIPNFGEIVSVVSSKFGAWIGPYSENDTIATTVGMINASNIVFRNKANWGASYSWSVTLQYTLKE